MPRVLDDRLRIASASFRGARQRGDEVLTSFWGAEVDRLLDQLNAIKELKPCPQNVPSRSAS